MQHTRTHEHTRTHTTMHTLKLTHTNTNTQTQPLFRASGKQALAAAGHARDNLAGGSLARVLLERLSKQTLLAPAIA